jgi:hypothetical protein
MNVMHFSLIHPSIIELYIDTLHLHLLQEKLNVIKPEEMTDELKCSFEEISSKFSVSAQTAEQIFGSSDIVQEQLNDFTFIIGDA